VLAAEELLLFDPLPALGLLVAGLMSAACVALCSMNEA
jgi:hypothetical protein